MQNLNILLNEYEVKLPFTEKKEQSFFINPA